MKAKTLNLLARVEHHEHGDAITVVITRLCRDGESMYVTYWEPDTQAFESVRTDVACWLNVQPLLAQAHGVAPRPAEGCWEGDPVLKQSEQAATAPRNPDPKYRGHRAGAGWEALHNARKGDWMVWGTARGGDGQPSEGTDWTYAEVQHVGDTWLQVLPVDEDETVFILKKQELAYLCSHRCARSEGFAI